MAANDMMDDHAWLRAADPFRGDMLAGDVVSGKSFVEVAPASAVKSFVNLRDFLCKAEGLSDGSFSTFTRSVLAGLAGGGRLSHLLVMPRIECAPARRKVLPSPCRDGLHLVIGKLAANSLSRCSSSGDVCDGGSISFRKRSRMAVLRAQAS